jgi:general secretion pathway protein K
MTLPGLQGKPGREGGFALLLVLWTLVPVSLMFIGLVSASRSEAQLTANLRGAAELEAVADGAIYTALFDRMQRGGSTRDEPGVTAQAPGVQVVVEVQSQSGLVNPNVASPALLRALMVRLGADPQRAFTIARAIADWRTPGQGSGPGAAKAPQYRAAGLDYGPPGAPFETLGELHDVLGMTPDVLAALAPHLTLYSDRDPDLATSDPVVWTALRDTGVVGRLGQASGQVIRITATVQRPDGTRAARRAIVRLGFSPNLRGWRVLAWDPLRDE